MPDPGFLGGAYEAPSLTQDAQECINWYLEIDPTKKPGERGTAALYPTPGLTLLAQLSANEVRALYALSDDSALIAVSGQTVYSVSTAWVATVIGTLATASGPVSIADNGTSAYLADGVNRYYYTWASNTFATVASTDGPFTGADQVGILDNYLIYNRPSSNQWGCTNASSVVSNALNLGAADSSPDYLTGVIPCNRDAFLIGTKHTEVWNDTGAFPFPFTRTPGTARQHGSAAAFSLTRLGESCAWLSRDNRGQLVVVRMNGYEPMRISTHAVETDIASFSTCADCRAYSYQQEGHEFYVMNFPAGDRTWVFDLSTGLWHKRAWMDSLGVLHRHRGQCAAAFNGQIVVGDWQNGRLYAFSRSVYTDNGDPIPAIRRCQHLTGDLRNMFHHDLQLQFQPGVGLQTGQGSNPQAMLRWSNDGGFTWSTERWKSMGKVGKYKNRARWTQLGEARDRIYEVRVTDPVMRVLVSAELNATQGAF